MNDPEVRFQIKGIANGRAFHIDGFRDIDDAVDTARAVDHYDRVIVVDEPAWDRKLTDDAVGILWDSAKQKAGG